MDDDTWLAYLIAHPDLLLRHQQLLRDNHIALPEKTPAPKKASDNVVDVTAKIATKARIEARRASDANQSLLNVAAENMLHWQELHLATLGFLACNELSGFSQMVHEELPLIFGLASAHLIMPSQNDLGGILAAESLGIIRLPQDEIHMLIGDDVIMMGAPSEALLALISAAPEDTPQSIAIMRLPDQLPEPIAGSVLILGGKGADSFIHGKGRTLLLHLSEMVGVCLLSLIEAPHHDALGVRPSSSAPIGQ